MFINPNNDRRIDTSATYTHRSWTHKPNNPLLAAYDRVSTKVAALDDYDCSLQEAAEVYETTEAHVLNFYRTYEPTDLALKLVNSRYEWRVLNCDTAFSYFESVIDAIRVSGILDKSLHPMHEQAEAYAKTIECPNERRTFARKFNQRIGFLNDRTPTGELLALARRAAKGDEEARQEIENIREYIRLKNAQKLNNLL